MAKKQVVIIRYTNAINKSLSDSNVENAYIDEFNCKKYDIVLVPTTNGVTTGMVINTLKYNENVEKTLPNTLEKIKSKYIDKILKNHKIKEIEKQLKEKSEKLDAMLRYKELAKFDEGIAKLLKDLEELK